MSLTVYFADKSVVFASEAPVGAEAAVVCADTGLSRAKILKILEIHNSVVVVGDDPRRSFDAFAEEFTPVEAAGGVVVNERGEWLMILRNGRWDLPKGHVEPDEENTVAAVREVAEETGVGSEIVRVLCVTLHAYFFSKTARWELKHTHWYELRVQGQGQLKPQTEEGIERVAWCSPAEVAENLKTTFPTIRAVAAAMKS